MALCNWSKHGSCHSGEVGRGYHEAWDQSCPDAKGFKCHGKEFGLSSSVIRKLMSPCLVFLLKCLLPVLPCSVEAPGDPKSSMVSDVSS